MDEAFSVDHDELDRIISDLEATERELSAIDADLARQLAALQGTWEGLAAHAQQEAYDEWRQGMAAMHAALVDMRKAARRAHTNYTAAARANSQMWGQVL